MQGGQPLDVYAGIRLAAMVAAFLGEPFEPPTQARRTAQDINSEELERARATLRAHSSIASLPEI